MIITMIMYISNLNPRPGVGVRARDVCGYRFHGKRRKPARLEPEAQADVDP